MGSTSPFIEAILVPEKREMKTKGVLASLFGAKPVEVGLIESYSVIYKGGHPDYPKEKAGSITFNVFPDRFEFLPTIGTQKWFNGLVIPFDKTHSLEIVERQVGTIEGILGGLNSRQLNQRNNIHITYQRDQDREILLRLEMLSGISVMGQAKKCQEFLDRLRTHGIFDKFRSRPRAASGPNATTFDIPTQIEKLAALREKGIITEEEFTRKKADLLSKM
jgi:hypothetical protein